MMPEADLAFAGLCETGRRIRAKELSPREVTERALERLGRLEPALRAFVTVTAEDALAAAGSAEQEIARGEWRSLLHGVPIALKDLCDTAGVVTTCGSPLFANRVPERDATVVERLRAAGAIILGKLKMTEGAFSAHHPDVVPPVNPWDAERWTGVSSSGSGVAVASGLAYGALGTDTGGSIRFPCASCGIVGLKPTWGRVSRAGIFPLAESLDHVGPMTRRVEDAAAILGVIAGVDERDPTTSVAPVPDYLAALEAGPESLVIGFDERFATEGVDNETAAALSQALDRFAALGVEICKITFPAIDDLLPRWAVMTAVEAAMAHKATFPSRREAYGPALAALLDLGLGASGEDYAAAHLARLAFRGALRHVLGEVDAILCPAMPTPPPSLAEMAAQIAGPDNRNSRIRFTAPFDFSGSPTISLPAGFTAEGVPIGFQLAGRDFAEASLLRLGQAYERATDWHLRRPPLAA